MHPFAIVTDIIDITIFMCYSNFNKEKWNQWQTDMKLQLIQIEIGLKETLV